MLLGVHIRWSVYTRVVHLLCSVHIVMCDLFVLLWLCFCTALSASVLCHMSDHQDYINVKPMTLGHQCGLVSMVKTTSH